MVGRKQASLTKTIFHHVKWTLRCFDKLEISLLLQGYTVPTASPWWQEFLATGPPPRRTHEAHPEALPRQSALVQCRAGAQWPSQGAQVPRWLECGVQPQSRLACLQHGDMLPSSASSLPKPVPKSGLVSKHLEARFASNATSDLKYHVDLPLGSSPPAAQISPSLAPRLLQTSPVVKTSELMMKLDKASRD